MSLASLLQQCLDEQHDLSAVERFSRRHEAGDLPEAGRWRDLLPAAPPAPGQQYAFEVDLDACTACKACVTACRSLNGLDEDESWRTVGFLHGGLRDHGGGLPVLQAVTTTCHHCLDPACLSGCPVNAYEKDPVTGIVAHLDDQCIGCGYCTFTCPYDVPRYNPQRGIVRKCDMCAGRLAVGEAPACAQACPNQAIAVVVVEVATVRREAAEGSLVPGAPPSAVTVPSTRYRSRSALTAALRPADDFAPRAARSEPPLAVMLVLTQLSVGAFAADLAVRALVAEPVAATMRSANALVALLLGLLALSASLLHLGRPLLAWRAVIGLRHSWLSREIVAFSAFAALALALAATLWRDGGRPSGLVDGLAVAVTLTGVAGVGCSVMVYAVTGRAWWGGRRTAVRFSLTTVSCGLATVLAVALGAALSRGGPAGGALARQVAQPVGLLLALATALKLTWEVTLLLPGRRPVAGAAGERSPAGRSDLTDGARLMLSPRLLPLTRWRFALGVLGGLALPLLVAVLAGGGQPPLSACAGVAVLALVGITGGELCERAGFFAAATSRGMPRELP